MKKKTAQVPILSLIFPDVFDSVRYAFLEHMPYSRQPWAQAHLIAKTARETAKMVGITANDELGPSQKMVISFTPPFSSLQADAEFIDATIAGEVAKYRKKLHLPYTK